MTMHKTICPYDCPTSCGLLAEVEDGRVVRVKGDPADPVCKGLICKKMQRYEKSINSPSRILTPLVRTGEKGSGTFAPVSWDEAAGVITDRWKRTLDEHGPDAVLPFYYSGVMSLIQRFCGDALFNRMGACTLVKTLCCSAKSVGYAAVMGKTGCLDPRELAHSDLHIVWGSNMAATQLQAMPHLARARKRGARVVLIEACAREMASYCDQVILVTPGSDGALALAMMHVLAAEGLADLEFLRREADGADEFLATLGQYTPAWAEPVTGVPAQTIVDLAHEFASASAPAITLGSGNSRHGNGGMTVRLITILSAFTGAWERPGGGLCGCSPGGGPYVDTDRITRPDLRSREGRSVNINQLASALRPAPGHPPIRCLHIHGCNPVGSVSNQQGIIDGLTDPALFTVVHERFMTDTARYADVVLPATFSVEHGDCYQSYGYRTFGVAPKLVPAPGQCKSNWDIYALLARAMGYEDSHFHKTEDAMLVELLDNPMPDLAAFTDDQWRTLRTGGMCSAPFAEHIAWDTPTGRMRIVNNDLDEPMPRYTENNGGAHPLRLVAVPSGETLNSIFLERGDLVDRRGPMTLALHPDDAAARDIVDNSPIVAFNDLGEVAFTAHLTPLVARGVAAAPGVYTTAQSPNGNLVNTLHHERLTDLGQATTINDNTIDVRPA